MRRVFRVSRKGKVKPIALSTLSAPEDLDTKLALTHASERLRAKKRKWSLKEVSKLLN